MEVGRRPTTSFCIPGSYSQMFGLFCIHIYHDVIRPPFYIIGTHFCLIFFIPVLFWLSLPNTLLYIFLVWQFVESCSPIRRKRNMRKKTWAQGASLCPVFVGPWSSPGRRPCLPCTMISRASHCTDARYVYVKSVFHINGSINFFTVFWPFFTSTFLVM